MFQPTVRASRGPRLNTALGLTEMNGHDFLVTGLERLLALPLQPKAALDAWYVQARQFEKEITERKLGIDMPHEIWHFLADADIRAKPNEEKYRQMQEGVVRNYIASLRKQ